MVKDDRFSAVDPALGYLYQVRLALLWSLRRVATTPDFFVSIETLDDVTFDDEQGSPIELLQTKHHRRSLGTPTDSSPDLWKTLRIWFEGIRDDTIPKDAALFLVTTAATAVNSAAFRLRAIDRDVKSASASLAGIASSSTNQSNEKAYEVFLETPVEIREVVLSNVVVVDGAPSIADVGDGLRREVFHAARREHQTPFLERLEGWWFRRVLRQLTEFPAGRIGSAEIEARMSDLRDQFKQDSLPIDDDLLQFELDEATEAAHANSVFVHQLQLVRAGKRRIAAAICDYYRAFEQRSRWLREDLIAGLDLDNYERRLKEEWTLVFEAMRDEIGTEATEEAKERAARSVLKWAERISILIRPAVEQPFVCRGSLHMLADERRVGWHPEFQMRLRTILGNPRPQP